LSSQATASPSIMQERERKRANVSTISVEAAGQIVAWTTIEPHSLTILAGNDSESIVLNLMQPQAAGRQRVGFGGKARRNEAGLVGPLRCADERATIARRAAP
jgi:hypothetical protein